MFLELEHLLAKHTAKNAANKTFHVDKVFFSINNNSYFFLVL